MSTRVKQRTVFKFLTVENVIPTEFHRRLNGIYNDDTIDRSTLNRRILKFRGFEYRKAIIVGETQDGPLITATKDKIRQLVDDLIQNDRRITQRRNANYIGTSKECFIFQQ